MACPAGLIKAYVHVALALHPSISGMSLRSTQKNVTSLAETCICANFKPSAAGETGLGKSTFVYNLVSGFKVLHPGRAHVEEATTMRQFKEDPSSLRTVLAPLDMPESNNRLIITIQVRDTGASTTATTAATAAPATTHSRAEQ